MKRIMNWLVPKEKELLGMLAEQSENILEAARELKKLLDDYSEIERGERKARAYLIKKIERKGDETTKKIFEGLNKKSGAFIDKEHTRQMALILKDIVDLLNTIASRFVVLSIERVDESMTKLVAVINSIAIEINGTILDLKKLKGMEEHCRKIRELEEVADKIYQDALSDLFHFYKNSIDIMKNKEIYDFLEEAADRCKDLANVIGDIAAKHL